ncbi:MAG: YggS family pyridoxal phosphate-dependent enzyme [Bacteroidota bacterium]|nr:YggS family pyridoxal phosphate-dependent enzyme [Bacteroidota bacterium]
MAVDKDQFLAIKNYLDTMGVTLVAVSKTKPAQDIRDLYDLGQRDFGENYVQELLEKYEKLPTDIRWHFIGHLQTNKVKSVASLVHLIQGVDSKKLLIEIDKQAKKLDRVIDCLLQVHIAREETKFGFDSPTLEALFSEWAHAEPGQIPLKHVRIRGFMGMATLTGDQQEIAREFSELKHLFEHYKKSPAGASMDILSMGMSDDYRIAIKEGSNMVRIGSLLFGKRVYTET